jgi:hypothetical protein
MFAVGRQSAVSDSDGETSLTWLAGSYELAISGWLVVIPDSMV